LQLLDSLFWRQRLPVMGTAANLSDDELRQQLATLFQQLGQDVQKRLTDAPTIARFLEQIRPTPAGPQSAEVPPPADPKT
jgi:hypothetical protein